MTSKRKGFYEKILDFKDLKLLHENVAENRRIYKATCILSNGIVSLKSYTLNSTNDRKDFKLDIAKEVKLTSQPDCPFIVRSFDDFVDGGRWWIIQEFCSAGSLAQILQNYDQDIEEGWVVSQTLDFMHERNLVHCSLSPENILFNSGKVAKLTGFQSVQEEGTSLSEMRLDRVNYLPPELLQNSNDSAIVSHQIDVWALGVISYEIVYGITPFLHMDDTIHVQNIVSKEVEFPWDVSSEFEDFVSQALSKDPMTRPTASELLMHPWIQNNIDWTPPIGFDNPLSYHSGLTSYEDESSQNDEMTRDVKGIMKKLKDAKAWRSVKSWSPFKWKNRSKVSSTDHQKNKTLMEMRDMANELKMKIPRETNESSSLESMTSLGSRDQQSYPYPALKPRDTEITINTHYHQEMETFKEAEEGVLSSVESSDHEELTVLSELCIDNPTPSPVDLRPQIAQSPSLDDIERFLMSE